MSWHHNPQPPRRPPVQGPLGAQPFMSRFHELWGCHQLSGTFLLGLARPGTFMCVVKVTPLRGHCRHPHPLSAGFLRALPASSFRKGQWNGPVTVTLFEGNVDILIPLRPGFLRALPASSGRAYRLRFLGRITGFTLSEG